MTDNKETKTISEEDQKKIIEIENEIKRNKQILAILKIRQRKKERDIKIVRERKEEEEREKEKRQRLEIKYLFELKDGKENIKSYFEWVDKFGNMTNKLLKDYCRKRQIKMSNDGVSNKYVLLQNVYQYIFGENFRLIERKAREDNYNYDLTDYWNDFGRKRDEEEWGLVRERYYKYKQSLI